MTPELYYCPNCQLIQEPDELHQERELMDPGVPGSWQTWVGCRDCHEDVWEVTGKEVISCLDWARDHVVRNPTETVKYINHVINMVEELL